MKANKWRKFLITVVVAAKIIVVVLILSSARSEEDKILNPVQKYESVEIPESLSFLGEKMPLERFDVREALDREILSNAYFHSQTIRYIKMAPRYFSVIEPILKENGVPTDFKYLALAESGFNPRAVSPASATGLWQFMKDTGKEYGLEINNEVDERYHVEKSTRAACNYLKDAYQKLGNWTLVAASFNAGMNGVQRQIERQKSNNYYDMLFVEETQRYVFRIVALKLILENPEKYHFYIGEKEKYPVIKTRKVVVKGAVGDFAAFARENGINYKLLKDFNPWLRDTKLSNPSGKSYEIQIPVLN